MHTLLCFFALIVSACSSTTALADKSANTALEGKPAAAASTDTPAVTAPAGKTDFFLYDADRMVEAQDRLNTFIAGHDVLFFNFDHPGGWEEAALIQDRLQNISDGKIPPDSLFSKDEPQPCKSFALVAANAVYRTGKRIYLEAAVWQEKPNAKLSELRTLSQDILPVYQKLSRRLLDEAISAWRKAEAARLLRLEVRDEAILAKILEIKADYPGKASGIVLEGIHTWPYLQAKERLESPETGYIVGYETVPKDIKNLRPNTHAAREVEDKLESGKAIIRHALSMALLLKGPPPLKAEKLLDKIIKKIYWQDVTNLAGFIADIAPQSPQETGKVIAAWLKNTKRINFKQAQYFGIE